MVTIERTFPISQTEVSTFTRGYSQIPLLSQLPIQINFLSELTSTSKSLPNSPSQITPTWLHPFLTQIHHLTNLSKNWNSYRSEPLNAEIVQCSLELLQKIMRKATPAPFVVPTAAGGLQLEWHLRQIDLEIEINSPDKFEIFYKDLKTQIEREGVFSMKNVSFLNKMIDQLSSRP